jgi:hypothetical protein
VRKSRLVAKARKVSANEREKTLAPTSVALGKKAQPTAIGSYSVSQAGGRTGPDREVLDSIFISRQAGGCRVVPETNVSGTIFQRTVISFP